METGISILERPPEVIQAMLPPGGPWRHFRKSLREEESQGVEEGTEKSTGRGSEKAMLRRMAGEHRRETPGMGHR